MATLQKAPSGSSGGSGGFNWGAILRDYGPAALEAYQAYSANRASNRATDEQVDAIENAGQLQYQTALQAMELARQRDMQTRLDTEQSRFGGYNAMRQIAQQLGLPVYNQPFNRTLDTFRPGGGGVGVGGTGGGGFQGLPGGPPMGIGDNQFRPRNPSAGSSALSGASTGASIGSAFGPIGTVVGGVIGGAAGYFGATDGGDLKDGSRVYATKNGTFFDARGNVIARVPPPAAGEPMKPVPGLQRNGAAIFIDDKGNIVRPNKSGGGYGTLTNLSNLADRPIELNGVIGRGYQPLPATDEEMKFLGGQQGGNIGILPGEAQGTGLMQDVAPEPLPEGRYGGFQQTPGYQFVLDEGLRARDKMAASRGRYFSGGTGRELERYAQGVASQEYDNYFRRLMDQVTGGNSATQFTSSAGASQTGSAIGSLTGGADSIGSALVAAGNARGSGILANQAITNAGVAGVAGSGIFDRLGSIFGGGSASGTTKSSSGAKSPLSSYNQHGYNMDSIRAYGG